MKNDTQEVTTPTGWVLVPIEPNWDMRNEGREFLIDGLEKDYDKIAYFLWKTMINASPKAPDTRPPVAGLADSQIMELWQAMNSASKFFCSNNKVPINEWAVSHEQAVLKAAREFLGKVE